MLVLKLEVIKAMKNNLDTNRHTFQRRVHPSCEPDHLIQVIWTMMNYQQTLLTQNSRENAGMSPLLPKLLDELHVFERKESLSSEEFALLYQIKVHLESFVR